MKIRMTKTVHGSLDGVTVRELVKDNEYETVASPRGNRLARHHIKQRVAVAVAAEAPELDAVEHDPGNAPAPAAAKPRRRK